MTIWQNDIPSNNLNIMLAPSIPVLLASEFVLTCYTDSVVLGSCSLDFQSLHVIDDHIVLYKAAVPSNYLNASDQMRWSESDISKQ